eukprot:FR734785.1.p1 GENE.FR734785.1~~FR734785.1.p1  ORF type:complete len:226 (+),score=19.15 FR734785.1:2-679(+)
MSQISHGHFKQRDCGVEIRTVTATFPEPTSQLESKYVWDQATGGGAAPPANSSSSASAGGGPQLNQQQPFSHARRRRSRQRYGSNSSSMPFSASCDNSSISSGDSSVEGSTTEAEPVELASQLPVWDTVNGCLMMKFLRKRVRLSSSKNVMMYRAEDLTEEEGPSRVDQDNAVYQFGKAEIKDDHKSVFVLDFRNPVAPLQAFALALSSFASVQQQMTHGPVVSR